MSVSWFAVTVHPKHEALAERGLRSHGFETYLPLQRVHRKWSDRVKTFDTVLFPGYVFCRFAAPDRLRVLNAPGVRSVVSSGRDPVPVAQHEIDSLRALIAMGRPIDLCPYLRAGEPVRVTTGALAGVHGIILRAQDNWRVVVSVEALGCSVSVEVDAIHLSPARKPPAATSPERIQNGHLQA